MGTSSSPNTSHYATREDADGYRIGKAATSLVAFHGSTPVAQAVAITTPTDLATSVTAITAILVALRNKGLIAT